MTGKQDNATETNDSLDQLRHLIMQPELDKIQHLQQRFDSKKLFSEEISRVLAEAVTKSNNQGNQLNTALLPVIEESIKSSVTNDPSFFANALYPILGPAIRKSIAEAFKELLYSLNLALENSFSLRSLQWRWESIRTGQSFAEVLLTRSLVYRSEQVFLIHRETGGLLMHVAIDDEGEHDADMVSGMLIAISDFASDSFTVEKKSTLNSFQIDNLTVLIESGPLAILAIAIRGTAPKNIREELRATLESIHLTNSKSLSNYTGDTQEFTQCRPELEHCLKTQYKEKDSSFLLRGSLLIGGVVLFISWLLFSLHQENVNWDHYIQQLKQEPGIVITQVNKQSGHYTIQGLRDPLAKIPQILRTEDTPVKEKNITYQLAPYQALTPDFILQRAEIALANPATISLSFSDGILTANGTASDKWQREARKLARVIAGVLQYDDSGIINFDYNIFHVPETVSLTLKKHVLIAQGSAPYQWIIEARETAASIAEIERYDDSGVDSIELFQLKALIPKLEQRIILFQENFFISPIATDSFASILAEIKQLLKLSDILGQTLSITITGRTDDIGENAKNIVLSKKRASSLYQYLVKNSIPESVLNVQGVGSNIPLGIDPFGADKKLNRSITLVVQITEPLNTPTFRNEN